MGDSGKTKKTTTTTPLVTDPVAIPIKNTGSSLDPISFNNLIISTLAAALLSWIPYEEDAAGNRIPTIIFIGQPTCFYAFVLFVMFGFSTSFSALFSYNRPKVARVFRSCSMIFSSSAAAVLLYAAFPGSGLRTWVPYWVPISSVKQAGCG